VHPALPCTNHEVPTAPSRPRAMQATFDPAVFVIKKHLVTAFCEEMRAVISEIQRRSMTVANA